MPVDVRHTRLPRLVLVVLTLILTDICPGQSLIRFDLERASLSMSFGGGWRNGGNLLHSRYGENRFRQWVVVPFSGEVLDKDIFRYTLELRPSFSQQTASGLPDPMIGRNLGVSAEATLMRARPLHGTVSWSRMDGRMSGGFGTQGEYDNSHLQTQLAFRNPYLPISASWSHRSSENVTQVGPQLVPIMTSDLVRTTRLSARNSKLNATYDRAHFTNRISETTYSTNALRIDHWFRWGKGSELVSRYSSTNRSGLLAFSRRSWTERLRIQHLKTAYTVVSMRRYRSGGTTMMSDGYSYDWRFSMQPVRWLNTGASAFSGRSRFDGGQQDNLSVGPDLGFTAELPGGARISGRASGTFVRRVRNADERSREVVDELRSVDETRTVSLESFFIDPETIVVLSGDGATVLLRGIDYEVEPVGSATQLRILPTGRIELGETVLVSYIFNPIADYENEGFAGRFGVDLRVGRFSLRHSRSYRSTSTKGDDTPSVTGDYDQQSTNLSYSGVLPIGRTRLDLGHRRRSSSAVNYEVLEGKASTGFAIFDRARVFLDVMMRRVREAAEQVDVVSANASVHWVPVADLRLRSGVVLQEWRRRLNGDQRIITGTASLDYRVGLSRITVSYNLDYQWSFVVTTGSRISVFFSRRF